MPLSPIMLVVVLSVICIGLACLRPGVVSFDSAYLLLSPLRRSKKAAAGAILAHPSTTLLPGKERQPNVYRRLYHQLHNLEDNSTVLSEARDALLTLFAEALTEARVRQASQSDSSILDINKFDPVVLSDFIRAGDDGILARLNEYSLRRDGGAPRELFQTREEARAWLIQRAPSKLVDGAWLGHIHRATTPFHLRPITKNAWQVLSEELGDGDLSKNHAAIFRQLLHDIKAQLPEADSPDFIEHDFFNGQQHDEAAEDALWKGATAQLLISLFPGEFLPEILGFNMHFECLTWDTVRAARELRELRLDDYYFLLHISIDNSDSGHTAMALRVVLDYLEQVRVEEGDEAVQRAWRRVQTGYLLSEKFTVEQPPTPSTLKKKAVSPPIVPPSQAATHNEFAPEVIRIFKAKATVAAKLHCGSRVTIGSKKLSAWLDHDVLGVEQGQTDFLTALSNARAWIRPGESAKSRLVREFEWNGKMFGAFTESELDVLKRWIDALVAIVPPVRSDAAYWEFANRGHVSSSEVTLPLDTDIRAGNHPVFSERGLSRPWTNVSTEKIPQTPSFSGRSLNLSELLPIWFAHASLLDGFVSIPVHTCTRTAAAVVRVMRAQRGFAAEGNGVSGMDEFRRPRGDCQGLLEIGLEMASQTSGFEGLPRSMREAVPDTSGFAMDMLHWGIRPVRNGDALLGMAWAFVELHEWLAEGGGGGGSVDKGVLSDASRKALRIMAAREREGLAACREEMAREGHAERVKEFEAAANFARGRIGQCFA